MIPDGWMEIQLGEISDKPQYGVGESAIKYSRHLPRYLRITDINEGGQIVQDNRVSVPEADYCNSILEEKDILFARTGNTVGKTYLFKEKDFEEEKVVFAGYLIRFKIKTELAHPEYIYQITNSSYYDNWVVSTHRTGAQPNINSKEYSNFPILLPPLPEQKKIAAILSSVDEAIQATGKVIDQSEKVKQGLLQELLTKGIGRPDLPEGVIPEGWKVKSLKNIITGKQLGANYLAKEMETGVPLIKMGNLGRGIIKLDRIQFLPER